MITSTLRIRKSYIGLDIGSSTMKFVEARGQGRTVTIVGYGMLPIAPNMILRGRIIKEQALEALLLHLTANYDLGTERVILGLNSPEISVKAEKLPSMKEDELEKAIEFELPDLVGFALDSPKDIAYSYDFIQKGRTEIEILFAACQRSLLDPYIRAINGVGLELHAIDLQALTWPRLFRQAPRVCFVDIGAKQMTLYAELDGIYKVYRTLPTGGHEITKGIMQAFQCDRTEAEKLQRNHHVDHLLANGAGPKTAIRTTFQEIIGGILQTLDFLRAEERASRIEEILDQVLLLGGTSHMQGLDDMLAQELGISVAVANPFVEQNLDSGLSLPANYAAYGSALGLAIRGLEG